MTYYLAIVACVLVAFQPDRSKIVAGAAVALPIMAQNILFWDLPGEIYYLNDMMFNVASLATLTIACPVNSFTKALVFVCAMSFGLNCYGWAIFEAGLPHTTYNYTFIAPYGYLILVLLGKDGARDRMASLVKRFSSLPGTASKGVRVASALSKAGKA